MTTVGIIPWGDTIEDYLEPIGLDLDTMLDELTDGWLFGYVEAMKATGMTPIVIVVSLTVSRRQVRRHTPTGVDVAVLPLPRASKRIRRHLGDSGGRRWVGSPLRRLATAFATAASTPLRSLGDVVDELDIDALIVQEYEYPRFDVLVRWARRRDLRVFGTFQGGDASYAKGERKVRAKSIELADGLLVAARNEIERVGLEHATSTPVHHVLNPIDMAKWDAGDRANARAELGIEQDAVLFLCHGRIDVHRKGLDVLVAAWNDGLGMADRERLVIVGSGDGDTELETLLNHAPPSVSWERRFVTSRSEIQAWVTACDVYVSASRTEGMAVAPIEAMAAGRAVVLTDVPGALELTLGNSNSGVVIVAKDDPEALRAAMVKLLNDSDLRDRLGAEGRANVGQRCSLDVVGAAIRRAIEQAP